jgi:hypothetical protein
MLARAGENLIPVRGLADVTDELVAERVVFDPDLREQPRVEQQPKALIPVAFAGHERVELVFDTALEITNLGGVDGGASRGKRRVDSFPVWKEQRVADIEENCFDFEWHGGNYLLAL